MCLLSEKQKLQIGKVICVTVPLVFFLLAVAILACRLSGIQCTGGFYLLSLMDLFCVSLLVHFDFSVFPILQVV